MVDEVQKTFGTCSVTECAEVGLEETSVIQGELNLVKGGQWEDVIGTTDLHLVVELNDGSTRGRMKLRECSEGFCYDAVNFVGLWTGPSDQATLRPWRCG